MAASIPDTVLDAQLGLITDATRVSACSQAPTSYAEATTGGTYALAVATISAADFAAAAADTSGRKQQFKGKTGASVSNPGTATYVVFSKSTDSSIKAILACTSQVLTAGNTLDFPAFYFHIPEPTQA
jgi:hypothetical protein